jgi:hypothetical protein
MTGSAQEDAMDCASDSASGELLSLPVELLCDILELCTVDSLQQISLVGLSNNAHRSTD